MPEQEAIPTAPQTPLTMRELRDAIFDRLDETKTETIAQLKQIEVTLLEKWMTHEKRLDGHDKDIGDLRGGRFPQAPLWALVVVATLLWLTIVVFATLLFIYAAHAPLALHR